MQIIQHLKAFISGMMGKEWKYIHSKNDYIWGAVADAEDLKLQELERIQPKRREGALFQQMRKERLLSLRPFTPEELNHSLADVKPKPKRKGKK